MAAETRTPKAQSLLERVKEAEKAESEQDFSGMHFYQLMWLGQATKLLEDHIQSGEDVGPETEKAIVWGLENPRP